MATELSAVVAELEAPEVGEPPISGIDGAQ